MTMDKALHSRDAVDRLYVSRKVGRRGFTSIEDNVDTSIRRLDDIQNLPSKTDYSGEKQHK